VKDLLGISSRLAPAAAASSHRREATTIQPLGPDIAVKQVTRQYRCLAWHARQLQSFRFEALFAAAQHSPATPVNDP